MSSQIEADVLDKAAEIAEMAVRGRPPFSKLPQYLPLNRNAEFLVRWSDEDKRQLIESVVASAKFSVAGERYRDEAALQKEKQLAAEQSLILRSRAKPIPAERSLLLKAFSVKDRKKIVKGEVEKRFPAYVPDKSIFERTMPGLLVFAKSFLEDNKLWIAFDLGAAKTDGIFESYVGVQKPFYSTRPASFYGASIRGVYSAPEELRAVVDETLDLLAVVLPVFEEKMRDILQKPRE